MDTPSSTAPKPSQQINRWKVSWYDGNGDANVKTVHGKLVLQEHHILIMDPDTKAIKWSVACVNAGPVEPAS